MRKKLPVSLDQVYHQSKSSFDANLAGVGVTFDFHKPKFYSQATE